MREARVLQVHPDMPGEADGGSHPLERNREAFLRILEGAERFDPDFVSFPELVLADDTDRSDRPLEEIAEPLPGPFIERVAEKAGELDSYVWVPTYERDGDAVYNSAAFVGPDDGFLGAYRKLAPTVNELSNRGVSPGRELPVWDTEFGRVGATICWDVRFDDIALGYRAKGLDLMFHPTHGLGRGKLAHWATYHGFHIAYCFTTDARIYTPHGNVLGRMRQHPTTPTVGLEDNLDARYSLATINTDMESYSQGNLDYGDTELADLQAAYPESVEIHSRHEEGIIVVESRAEDLRIEELEAEFDLPTNEDAERRTRELVAEATAGSPMLGPDYFDRAAESVKPGTRADDD